MTTALMADIASGNTTLADWLFLIAAILAVIAAVGHFGTNQVTKHRGWLLCLAVGCAAVGWLVL